MLLHFRISVCELVRLNEKRRQTTFATQQKLTAAFLSLLPQMLPATFVVNNDGREACFCPLPEDADGLYVLFFNQGASHGSKKKSRR